MRYNPNSPPGMKRRIDVSAKEKPPTPGISKEQFLIQYVLNRALTASSGLSGDGAAEAGIRAWDTIQKACAK